MSRPTLASTAIALRLKHLISDPVILLFYVGVFTVSFDILLVLNLGFNIRFAQILWMVPIAVAIVGALIKKRLKLPLAISSLWLWFVFIAAFIPNATLVARSVGYVFWLGFSILLIVATCQIFDTRAKIVSLLTCYVNAFLFVGLFGIYQFFSPFLRLPPFLVLLWWDNTVPRINGFSYEPSYFATYILIGWTLCAALLRQRHEIIDKRHVRLVFYVLSVVMLLSSSRMGWIMMMVWYAQYPAAFLLNLFKGKLSKVHLRQSLLLVGFFILVGVVALYIVGFEKASILLAGTGLAGMSNHSAGQRTREFFDTLTIFANSPFYGYSLGGIASAVGGVRDIYVNSLAIAKQNEGMATFAEALAASGAIGIIPFGLYIASLVLVPLDLARKTWDRGMAALLRALVLALVFELAILQMNQNILRPYLWLHIAILSAAFSVARGQLREKREPAPDPAPAEPADHPPALSPREAH